jgi:transcriptional regulator with XRE-family HTH domain
MELNMSQPELARYFGVHGATISKWELGATPREESFNKLQEVNRDPIILYKFYGIVDSDDKEPVLEKEIMCWDKKLLKEQIDFLERQLRDLELRELLESDEKFTATVSPEFRELVYEYMRRESLTLYDYINQLVKEHIDKETKQ